MNEIIKLMVGRELKSIFPPKAEQTGEEILSVHGLSDRSYFHDITFRICRGEIVGIGALDGQGPSAAGSATFRKTARCRGCACNCPSMTT